MNVMAALLRGLRPFLAAAACCCAFASDTFAAKADDTAVIDRFIAAQAQREHGEEYRGARKIVVGNLTGDAAAQTVVLYTIEGQNGSNDYVQYLAVFAHRPNGLTALTHAAAGGKSERAVELSGIANGAIVLTTLGYAAKDASCCPSVKGSTRYVLVDGVLREKRDSAQR